MGDVPNLEIHVHSVLSFENASGDGDYDHNYRPAFTSGIYVNGIQGKFAIINMKQGSTLKVRAHAYDADKNQSIHLPHAALSFFDLDTGAENVKSVEHVSIGRGYSAYWLSNETEVNVTHKDGLTVFTATKEGNGKDNPSDPVQLTELQKDRAITIEY